MAGQPAIPSSAMSLVQVGEIVRAHGIRGELVVSVAAGRLRDWEAAEALHLGPDAPPIPIKSAHIHQGRWLVLLQGVRDRNAAEALRARPVFVKAIERAAAGWWPDDWLGFTVIDEGGAVLGRLTEVIHTGANDVIVVVAEGQPDLLLPVIADVILKLDLDTRQLTVHVLDGLRG